MTRKNNATRLIAITLAAVVTSTSLVPTGQAFAHDRHNAEKHFGDPYTWNKRKHRQFHNQWGRGHAGVEAYRQHQHAQNRRHKRNKRGDLIAAGILGLALGAIVVGSIKESKKQRSYTSYDTPQRPVPLGNHNHDTRFIDPGQDPYGYDYQENTYNPPRVSRVPLDDYQSSGAGNNSQSGPNVITYEDTVSLEPWTPGWYEYCASKYRSFNPAKGTFFGYDGEHHFCVPK